MSADPISDYLREVRRDLAAGDATEHTHRAALAALIQSLERGVRVINEPKHRTDCGAPIRLTTNEWLKARQLGPTYWLYVVWDPKAEGAIPTVVRDPAHALEHAAKEIATTRFFEIPALAIQRLSVGEGQR